MFAGVDGELPLVFSWWIAPLLAVASVAIAAVVRGITAEVTVRRGCHEDVLKVRDTMTTTEIWPALSRVASWIVVALPRTNKWAGETTVDPALSRELLRIMKVGFAVLESDLEELEKRTTPLIWAALLHDRLVALVRATGVFSGVLLVPLGYFAVRLVTPTLIEGALLTIPLDALGMLVLGLTVGPVVVLWAMQVSLNQQLSKIVRGLKPAPSGSTS